MRGGEWRSTEDAPRDGRWILGLYPDHCRVVRWREGKSMKRYESGVKVWFWSDGYFRHGDPEAWMPLLGNSDPETVKKPAPKPSYPPAPRITRTIEVKRRTVVAHKPMRRVLVEQRSRQWCDQCERSLTAQEAGKCDAPFCKAKAATA